MLLLTWSQAIAAMVEALKLPAGLVIQPEGASPAFVVASDGTVYAMASSIKPMGRTIVLRWKASGYPEIFEQAVPMGSRSRSSLPQVDSIAAGPDSLYVTFKEISGGATLTIDFHVEQWTKAREKAWSPPTCAIASDVGPRVSAVDSNRVAITLDPSMAININFDDPASIGRALPTAIITNGSRCVTLGRAVVTALKGPVAVGYRGYINDRAAPLSVDLIAQRIEALRWQNGNETDLGIGVPFSTTRSGFAVGATALPGYRNVRAYGNLGTNGRQESAVPHAVAWDEHGKEILLTRDDVRSVAWDVGDGETVVGTALSRDGAYRAFRWMAGRFEFLDDIPHPNGWLFQSAYALKPDGAIVGVGTYKNVVTGFIWRN